MGDATGQVAQRLQLLRLAQCCLSAVTRGNVVDHRKTVQEESGRRIAFRTCGEDDIGNLTGGLDQAVLDRSALQDGYGSDQFGYGALSIERCGGRFKEIGKGPADRLGFAVTGVFDPRLVHLQQQAIRTHGVDGDRNALERGKYSVATRAADRGCNEDRAGSNQSPRRLQSTS